MINKKLKCKYDVEKKKKKKKKKRKITDVIIKENLGIVKQKPTRKTCFAVKRSA